QPCPYPWHGYCSANSRTPPDLERLWPNDNGRRPCASPRMNPKRPEETARRYIRHLIWLYFWLLLVEGALRKWVLPDLSNPLLVVRDPVVLAIYLLSFRARVFPKNAWVAAIVVMAILTTLATFFQLWEYVAPSYI